LLGIVNWTEDPKKKTQYMYRVHNKLWRGTTVLPASSLYPCSYMRRNLIPSSLPNIGNLCTCKYMYTREGTRQTANAGGHIPRATIMS
jgi:hypothetical protein